MENPKRARSGKPRTQPRGGTYEEPSSLQSALERIRQIEAKALCRLRHPSRSKQLKSFVE